MGKTVMKVVGVRMGRHVTMLPGPVHVPLGGEAGSVTDVSTDKSMSDCCKSPAPNMDFVCYIHNSLYPQFAIISIVNLLDTCFLLPDNNFSN